MTGKLRMEMLTAKEMEALLQVDRSTVYRMAEAGQLPAIKVGKQWRFPSAQVERWLSTRMQAPASGNANAVALPVERHGLKTLLPLGCVQSILDMLAEAWGVMVAVTDMDGGLITEPSNPCRLFDALAGTSSTSPWGDHRRMLARDLELEPQYVPDPVGLLYSRGLIRVGTRLEGMALVGGIASTSWLLHEDQLNALATQHDVPIERVRAAASAVHRLDQAERDRLLPSVQRLANVMARMANERRELVGRLQAIAELAG